MMGIYPLTPAEPNYVLTAPVFDKIVISLDSKYYNGRVLIIEKDLTLEFPSDQKYVFENRGQSLVKVYSKEFSLEYSKRMNDMVEERMRAAILSIASYWYTAWVNAGQPNLDSFDNKIKKEILEKNNAIVEGEKVNSRPHND